MAAIPADDYSNELDQVRAPGHEPLKPNEEHGRVRFGRFTFETPETTGTTDGTNIFVYRLPKGARVLEIFMAWEAMGTTAACDVGLAGADGSGYIDADDSVADDDDLFAAAIDVSSAGENICADTIAQNYGYELGKECYLVLTAETANWAAEKDMIGHVLFVVD